MAELRGPSVLRDKHDRDRFTWVRDEAAKEALVEQNRRLDVRVLAAPRPADEREFAERPARILPPAGALPPALEFRGTERAPIERLEQRELVWARGEPEVLPIRPEDLDGWHGRPSRLGPRPPLGLTGAGEFPHAFGACAPLRFLRGHRHRAALVAHPMTSTELVSAIASIA